MTSPDYAKGRIVGSYKRYTGLYFSMTGDCDTNRGSREVSESSETHILVMSFVIVTPIEVAEITGHKPHIVGPEPVTGNRMTFSSLCSGGFAGLERSRFCLLTFT